LRKGLGEKALTSSLPDGPKYQTKKSNGQDETRHPMRLPFFYGWVIVVVTFVTMAIGVNARTAFSLFFPPILDEFGWERGITAGAFSFGFLVSAAVSPLIGRLMDRFGPRAVMELGVALMGGGLLLAPLTTQPWHLYLTIGVMVGAGSVCLGYSGQSLFLPNWFNRRRGLAMGLAFAGVGIGSMTLLPWVQHMIVETGWRTACTAMGILVFAVLAPINLLLRKRPEDIGLLPDGDAAPSASSAKPVSNIVDPEWAGTDWTLRRAIATARFWWISLGYFGGLYIWYAVQVHQTKYLLDIGFSPAVAVWALGAVSLLGIPGQIWLGHLSDRIGRESIWAASCLGFAICFAALIGLKFYPSLMLVYLMVLAQGALGYGLTSIIGAVVLEIFQGKQYGSIFGTIMIAALAGGAAGPWLTGLLHDLSGNYTLAFTIGIGVSALSAFAIWMASPGKIRAVAGQLHRVHS
jgi:MFS family permease